MRSSVILLFLQLWGNVAVSLSQNVCSTLPDVPHGLVSDPKSVYQEGHVIHFTCEPGYTSTQTIKYVCTSEGWLAVHLGRCYSCSTIPDVPHALLSEDSKKADYQVGDMIQFTCAPGYTLSQTIKYVCSNEGWLAIQQGRCFFSASGCDPPPADGGIRVIGLPENDNPIVPHHIIIFSCVGPGKHLDGRSVLICGQDGQWSHPFPSCRDNPCEIGVMDPHLFVAGLPPANEAIKFGHKLQFQCNSEYELEGSEEIECLQTGQWNAPFPTCTEQCSVPDVPFNLRLLTHVQNGKLKKGQMLRFGCSQRGHILRGNEVTECLANGRWNNSFPTCGVPLSCGRPPALENGDTMAYLRARYRHKERVEFSCQNKYAIEGGPHKTCIDGEWIGEMRCVIPSGCGTPPPLQDGDTVEIVQYQYRHNDRVEYSCQNLYTMEGRPYKTCYNGKWIGEIRCLKPCTVDAEAMSRQNIAFKYTYKKKLYAPHNDEIDFICVGQSIHDGVFYMRQRCVDGVIHLPTCLPRW